MVAKAVTSEGIVWRPLQAFLLPLSFPPLRPFLRIITPSITQPSPVLLLLGRRPDSSIVYGIRNSFFLSLGYVRRGKRTSVVAVVRDNGKA